MSHPSLLEDHLLSRYPVSGWLSKRFGISTKIWVCPTLSALRQKYFYSNALSDSLAEFSVSALFKEFSVALCLFYFALKSAALFQQNFHDVRRYFNLKAVLLYHKAVVERRGFKPRDLNGQLNRSTDATR